MKAVDAFFGPSVRFAHRVFVERRSHPAVQASKKGSIRSLFENRGSQIVPRHVVPLHPFGAVLASGSKTLSVRMLTAFLSNHVLIRLCKHQKKAPFGAFSKIGVARLFRVTSFRSTPSGPSLRPAQKRYPFASLTAFLSNAVLIRLWKRQKKGSIRSLFENRGSQIRTDDILLPKQTLYQAELHPVASPNIEKVLALESFALCQPDFRFAILTV